MEIKQLTAPRNQVDFSFFTFQLEHQSRWYKGAAAEETFGDGEVTGAYDILLQSASSTYCFTIVKDGDGNWETESHKSFQDIVFKMGEVINNLIK